MQSEIGLMLEIARNLKIEHRICVYIFHIPYKMIDSGIQYRKKLFKNES